MQGFSSRYHLNSCDIFIPCRHAAKSTSPGTCGPGARHLSGSAAVSAMAPAAAKAAGAQMAIRTPMVLKDFPTLLLEGKAMSHDVVVPDKPELLGEDHGQPSAFLMRNISYSRV